MHINYVRFDLAMQWASLQYIVQAASTGSAGFTGSTASTGSDGSTGYAGSAGSSISALQALHASMQLYICQVYSYFT